MLQDWSAGLVSKIIGFEWDGVWMRVNIFSFSSFSFSPVSGRVNVVVAYLATFRREEDLSAQCHNRTLLKEIVVNFFSCLFYGNCPFKIFRFNHV